MIQLIATDVDGTLVKDSSKEVYEELLDAVGTLADRGIHVVVASGRQYASIYKMFEKVAHKIDFIAENCPAAFLFTLERFVCYANTAHCDFFAEFCRNSA